MQAGSSVHVVLRIKWRAPVSWIGWSLGSPLFQGWKRNCKASCRRMWGIPTLKTLHRSNQKTQEMCTLNFGFHFPCEFPFPNHGGVVWRWHRRHTAEGSEMIPCCVLLASPDISSSAYERLYYKYWQVLNSLVCKSQYWRWGSFG